MRRSGRRGLRFEWLEKREMLSGVGAAASNNEVLTSIEAVGQDVRQYSAAAVYYVNQAIGSNGDGTQAHPFATISQAACVARPGDTIIIASGVYREYVQPQADGVTYEAAPGATPLITGMDVLQGWTAIGGGTYRLTAAWKYEFAVNPPGTTVGHSEQVAVNGVLLKQVFSRSGMPVNSFMADTVNRVLYVNLGGVDPNTVNIEAATRSCCFGSTDAHNNITLRGIAVRFCANAAQTGAVHCVGNDWTIDNVSIDHCNGSGLYVRGSRPTLTNVSSTDNGQQGAGMTADNFTVANCHFDRNNIKGYDKDWEAGGVKFEANTDNHLASGGMVSNTTFNNNNGVGGWCDGLCDGIVFEGCEANGNARSGYQIEISRNCTLLNCKAIGNDTDEYSTPLAGIFISSSQNVTVSGCTSTGNALGISLWNENRTDGKGISFGGHRLTGNTLANNILAQLYYGSPSVDHPQGLVIDQNSYGLQKGLLAIWDTNRGYSTFATLPDWQNSDQARWYQADQHPNTRTWTGGGGNANWTADANWSGAAAPWATDALAFPAGAAQATNTNGFSTGSAFNSLTFSGGGYNISGNPVTLTGGITNTGSVPADQTNQLALNVQFASATTSVAVDSGTLILSGGLSANGTVIKTGAGTLIISGPQNWGAGSALQIGGSGGSSPVPQSQLAAPDTAKQAGTLPQLASAADSSGSGVSVSPALLELTSATPPAEAQVQRISELASTSAGPVSSLTMPRTPEHTNGTSVAPAVDGSALGAPRLLRALRVTLPFASPSEALAFLPQESQLVVVAGPEQARMQQPARIAIQVAAQLANGGPVAVATAAAHDAALVDEATHALGREIAAGKLNWLYAYEGILAKRQKKSSDNDNPAEKSVDAVLAMYWS